MATAFAHCRPGGVALFVPDGVRETFTPKTEHGGRDRGDRSMRCLEWTHDPDPSDRQYVTFFAFLLRDGDGPVTCVTDEHRCGLFPRDTWLRLLGEVGFEPALVPDPAYGREMFTGRRRA